jgi:hypothetical protein
VNIVRGIARELKEIHTIMNKSLSFVMVMVIVLSLGTVGVAFAQEEPVETQVEGVVVSVDEEAGTVDILQADGTTVTVALPEGEYEHPITQLLAEYFGGSDAEDYAAALEELEMDGSVVVDVDESVDDEGNPVWEVTLADGNVATVTDPEAAQALLDALEVASVDLNVTDEGGVLTAEDIGEQIEEYREMGLGYGDLVKIYAIAQESQEACQAEEEEAEAGGEDVPVADGGEVIEEPEEPCGVTVEELAQMLVDGYGMGQLFKDYGKPALLGVGHVRKALNAEGDGEGGDGSKGVCNARSKGGKANAKGQDVNCP